MEASAKTENEQLVTPIENKDDVGLTEHEKDTTDNTQEADNRKEESPIVQDASEAKTETPTADEQKEERPTEQEASEDKEEGQTADELKENSLIVQEATEAKEGQSEEKDEVSEGKEDQSQDMNTEVSKDEISTADTIEKTISVETKTEREDEAQEDDQNDTEQVKKEEPRPADKVNEMEKMIVNGDLSSSSAFLNGLDEIGEVLKKEVEEEIKKQEEDEGIEEDNAVYPQTDWMGNLPEELHEVPLPQLAIPGSHNSLAIKRDMSAHMPYSPNNPAIAECIDQLPNGFALFDAFKLKIKEMNRDWSATQSSTITQQLKLGIRYFDMNVAMHQGIVCGELTGDVITYLAEVKQFLDEHVREVVILHFQNTNNLDEKELQKFILSLREMFGSKIIPRTQIQMTTLNSLWSYGQQVMLLFKDDKVKLLNRSAARQVWPADTIVYNPWPDMQEGHQLIRFLDKHYECAGADTESKFHVSQGVLSTSIEMAFAGKLEHGSLEEMSVEDAQPRLMKWMEGKISMYVLTTDFVNQTIVDKILEFNKD